MKNKKLLNPANRVTLIRIALLFLLVALVYFNHPYINFFTVFLCLFVFYLDQLDGYLARKLKCKTDFGSVLDVAGDRIVENVLWILLAWLKLIPIWMPILVISKGFVTDSFRSYALSKGKTTFAMMHSRLGKLLVASPLSRSTYALSKAVLFASGLAIHAFGDSLGLEVRPIFDWLARFVVLFCLIRGFFTVKDALLFFGIKRKKSYLAQTYSTSLFS